MVYGDLTICVECLIAGCGAALHSLGANSFIILRWAVKLLVYINSGYYRPLPRGEGWLTPDTPYFEQLQLYNLAQDCSPQELPQMKLAFPASRVTRATSVALVLIFSLFTVALYFGQSLDWAARSSLYTKYCWW